MHLPVIWATITIAMHFLAVVRSCQQSILDRHETMRQMQDPFIRLFIILQSLIVPLFPGDLRREAGFSEAAVNLIFSTGVFHASRLNLWFDEWHAGHHLSREMCGCLVLLVMLVPLFAGRGRQRQTGGTLIIQIVTLVDIGIRIDDGGDGETAKTRGRR